MDQQLFFAKEDQKNREILDSRIVGFTLPGEIQPSPASYLIGRVIDADTKEPLKASVEIIELKSNNKLYENTSDSISGEFYMVLPPGGDLGGYVKKKGYLYTNFHFDTQMNYSAQDTLVVELEKIAKGQSLVLKNIYFDTDSYELDKRSLSEINNVVQLLTDNPEIQIEIAGHTDNIGNKSYNQVLSEKRAISVYEKLIEAGIDKTRTIYKGYGDADPIKDNSTESNRQSNRRIEFRVLRLKQ